LSRNAVTGNRRWLLALVVVTLLSLTVIVAPGLQAADGAAPVAGVVPQGQIYSDDFQVESGQTIEGDVVVYSGDAKIERGGRLAGNLTVYSGDIEVEEGGVVDGSVTSLSGDVQIDGTVGGSVSAMSGDVELGDNAVVAGDISVVSGRIKERAGARVDGSLLRGPDIKWPFPPKVPGVPGLVMQEPAPPVREMTLAARVLDWVGRGMLAALLLGLAVGGAAATMALRPQWVDNVQSTLRRQSALSFATGLIINVVLVAFISVLYFLICFAPLASLLAVALAALNIVGFAAVGDEIGRRMMARSNAHWPPVANVAIGVFVPGAVLALLWWFGGCFAFFAYLGAIVFGSFGVGALVARLMKLDTPRVPAGSPTAAPTAPVPSAPTPPAPVAQPEAGVSTPVPADADVAPSPVPPAATETRVIEQPLVEPETVAPAPVADDDFTKLPGIGPKLNQRLRDAGLRTFADVAARSPAELGAMLDWSADRVARSGLIEQASLLAGTPQ
jgi:predicted flap endonuclease-1-like 5' DNA nuclease/cytoskeletal protein CcmA (bactofilin family)